MKSEFIKALKHFVRTNGSDTPDGYGRVGYSPSRGQVLLTEALAKYFTAHPEIPEEHEGINWFVDLPEYLVRAYLEFRTHERFTELRVKYANEMGEKVLPPDLLDSRGGVIRQFVVADLVRLMPILAGRIGPDSGWLVTRLEAYLNAQQIIIDQAWGGFVRKTHPALADRIKKESHRGNSGVFGGVCVRSYAIAGRVMFTFERDGHTVTAVCDDSDMLGFRSGLNHCFAPFTIAYQIIVDATENWDIDKFVRDDDVGFSA